MTTEEIIRELTEVAKPRRRVQGRESEKRDYGCDRLLRFLVGHKATRWGLAGVEGRDWNAHLLNATTLAHLMADQARNEGWRPNTPKTAVVNRLREERGKPEPRGVDTRRTWQEMVEWSRGVLAHQLITEGWADAEDQVRVAEVLALQCIGPAIIRKLHSGMPGLDGQSFEKWLSSGTERRVVNPEARSERLALVLQGTWETAEGLRDVLYYCQRAARWLQRQQEEGWNASEQEA